jgi:hypothetical protein
MPQHRPRSTSRRPPQLYPIATIARQRRADHVDCDDGTHNRPACGVCDQCMYAQTAYLVDHPSELSLEELAHLC